MIRQSGAMFAVHRACRQRGVALILVLWACALMAIVLGGFAAVTRSEGLQARYQLAQTRARYAAEAGLARAVAALHDPNSAQRWRGDGQPYTFPFAGARVTVTVTDEDGKVDLNTATPKVLAGFLRAEGVKAAPAHALAAAIADWRDRDDLVRPDGAEAARYRQAGRTYGPRNGPFASLAELQLVLGMNATLYARIAPLVTIWSGRRLPNPAHAPVAVLAGLPNMDKALARRYVALRGHADLTHGLPALPNGMVATAGAGGGTHSIVSIATLPDGVRAVLHATIRQRGDRPNGTPYVILRWQEGSVGD